MKQTSGIKDRNKRDTRNGKRDTTNVWGYAISVRVVNACGWARRVELIIRVSRTTEPRMSEDRSDEDPLMDLWYSNWEQQSVEALETEPDYEIQLHNEKELYSQQMWTSFQTTASAIAQLYKGKLIRRRYQSTDSYPSFRSVKRVFRAMSRSIETSRTRCSYHFA